MRKTRLAIVTLMMLSLSLQSFEAGARVGNRSSSSYSSRSSMSAPSSAPQRVGGGGNAGMQRSDVMNQVRSNPQGAQPGVTPQPMPAQPQLGAQAPAQQPRQFGVGSMVGAAAAGAAVGYLANSAMHNGYNNAPQAASGANGSYGAPLAADQRENSSSPWGFILLVLLGTAAIMGFLMMLSRRREAAAGTAPVYTPRTAVTPLAGEVEDGEKQEFERNALKFFNDLQEANNRGDATHMQQHVIEPLRSQLIADIEERATPSRTQTMMMKAERVDLTEESDRSIASVRFRGMISEDPNAASEQIDEVWHFVRARESGSQWQLAGIEQV